MDMNMGMDILDLSSLSVLITGVWFPGLGVVVEGE
jgi:hypothetical protein